MKFSLIMGTIGQTNELPRFLDSLTAQTYPDFELIVVDQSNNDKIQETLAAYQSKFPILHFQKADRGISRARNVGLLHATGDVIAFPDDDCWYATDLLAKVKDAFQQNISVDGLSGRVIDNVGNFISRYANRKSYITRLNAWGRASSIGLFLKKELVRDVGPLDETLGVGTETIWRGAEDIDYPIRAAKLGLKILYNPEIVVFHPASSIEDEKASERAYYYGAGIGRVWKKHDYPLPLVGYYLLRPLGGAMLATLRGNAAKREYYWKGFQGRWIGWRSQ